MDKNEYTQHWNYFCSLAERLDETKNYVFHGLQDDENGELQLIHGDVYSDCFKQIIILAASEFETISKALCTERGEDVSKANIIDISKTLLKMFPKITETEIITLFWGGTPLREWKIDENGHVVGLDWWRAYNSLKHNEESSYQKATFENALLSVSALYILNLYLMYEMFHSLSIAYQFPPVYFKSKYTAGAVVSGQGLLPDYGNKSPIEVLKEKYPEFFKNDGETY